MSDARCPACTQTITLADINIGEGVALCRPCGKLHRLADVAQPAPPDPSVLDNPPRGCRWDDTGADVVLTVSLRSPVGSAFLTVFAVFWNSLVSVFVFFALAGLYINLIGPLPVGLPSPTNNSGGPMSLGFSILMCVFLIPFVLVGAGVGAAAVLNLIGRYEITIRGHEGAVRTVAGPFGWTRRFDASAVREVAITYGPAGDTGHRQASIRIAADRTLKFGSMLTEERREWLIAVLRTLLNPNTGDARRSTP